MFHVLSLVCKYVYSVLLMYYHTHGCMSTVCINFIVKYLYNLFNSGNVCIVSLRGLVHACVLLFILTCVCVCNNYYSLCIRMYVRTYVYM